MSDALSPFALLASPVRRAILFGLVDAESLAVPDDLATGRRKGSAGDGARAGGGVRRPGAGAGSSSGGELATELYHNHLPKLVEAGVVEWDREAGTVSRGERFAEIGPLLELLANNRERIPDAGDR